MSDKTALGESGQNNGGVMRGKGIGNFCRSRGMSERSGAKDFQPVVLPGLQGKGLCGKKAFLLN
ncbi:hypothetical protein [Mucilaginibacter phyllosphaerae]|uniref:Uncharacterized protein n=1 Tax=Mucilaginibacter phyllosphaerae TaxID=1812349 RepID=A0A4Y8A611_9SPHI|nr:hypothetical protein [Mucilaginibacter phyllosphaerae]MBB3971110.1 hypothetical protein [Mucilaginibacter phyllosphaerae]TEW63844.1 hypothetical protein E2R65_18950 [Mucilaginibacter phyllosphaerae]